MPLHFPNSNNKKMIKFFLSFVFNVTKVAKHSHCSRTHKWSNGVHYTFYAAVAAPRPSHSFLRLSTGAQRASRDLFHAKERENLTNSFLFSLFFCLSVSLSFCCPYEKIDKLFIQIGHFVQNFYSSCSHSVICAFISPAFFFLSLEFRTLSLPFFHSLVSVKPEKRVRWSRTAQIVQCRHGA